MGTTIHYYGHARSDDDVDRILDIAQDYAARKEWWRRRDVTHATLTRSFGDGELIEYEGRVRRIVMIPESACETVRLEFDDNLFTWWFTKTVGMRVESHIEIVELLRTIQPHMADLEVRDEGEYWETGDVDRLRQHLDRDNIGVKWFLREMRARRAPDN